jgi:hypothetical protein
MVRTNCRQPSKAGRPWQDPVLDILRRMGVPVFSPESSEPAAQGVVFLIGDDDLIVADDFEVEVSELVHEPQWFQPAVPDC